jgi:hypothetical protein
MATWNCNSPKIHPAWHLIAVASVCLLARASELPLANAAPPPIQVRPTTNAVESPRAQPPALAVEARRRSEDVHLSPIKDEDALTLDVPPAILSEVKRIDAMRRELERGTPIERWRFDDLRARYQALLKSLPGEPAAESVIRNRLECLAQREQAAKAAASLQAILAQSHSRDHEIVELRRRLRIETSATKRTRSNTYQAVGFMQSSAQKYDGHKLYLLVGPNGETVAYLDIPPGLDPEPAIARKVGVRGVAHYSEELKSRLITVSDLRAVDSRR